MTFPQLNTVTAFSLLQSTLSVERYVTAAKERGYQTIGICDRNVLTGAVAFYEACQKAGLQPIMGLHLDYYSPVQKGENELLLFAKNQKGYEQLVLLSSQKMTQGKVTLEAFAPFDDLIAVLPERNELQYLLQLHPELLEARYQELAEMFPLFVGRSLDTKADAFSEWTTAKGIPPFALMEVVSLESSELSAVRVMEHIKNGTQIGDLQELDLALGQPLWTEEQIRSRFAQEQPEALAQAEAFAADCHWDLPLHQKLYPNYPMTEGNAPDFLRQFCQERLPQRVKQVTAVYQERLEYELSVIHQMGFDDYFLIVWDVMDFAHRQKIVTGAGRGSAAGSLVAYVLSITDVDPIQYDLLFERFLNPERYTMPDIDLDIPDNRREEVLHYVQQKYGPLRMAQIATFGTMAAKMVLRDVARVFGLSQSEANRWSKAVPNKLKITLQEAYDTAPTLRNLVKQSPKNQRLFQIALILEGLPRHVSTHAAGVVISDRDLTELVPLQAGSEEIFLTQFTMNDVEAIGLLKMDFLGLRNLSIIDNTLRGIKQATGREFSQKEIPLDDAETIALFQRGDTSGVFQFESAGIRNVLRRLGPENIEEIAAVNALYRPGPMQNIEHYIQRKKGKEAVSYPDDSLQDILKNTYGIMVYQEQVMQVAAKMAGFSLGQADILRRAIGKKKKAALDEQRTNFVEGAVAQGHPASKANQVYDYIERFADYGFNRAHAFAYSFVGFQMGYLKVHYPGPFYAALLRGTRNNPAKVKEYLAEAKKRSIQILPPDINQSSYGFYLAGLQQIRFGLGSIKGIRRDFIGDIVKERQNQGPFTSLDNFLYRIDSKWRKQELLLPLIEVGAFDSLEPKRRQLASELEGKIQNIQYSGGSMDLLDLMALKVTDIRDYSLEERLNLEEQYLGVYLSGHPAEKYESLAQRRQTRAIAELVPEEKVRILFYVRDIREIRTKKGDLMSFVEGNDPSGELSVTIFPELYRRVRQTFQIGDVLYLEGKVEMSKYNGEMQLIANELAQASELQMQVTETTCYLRISPEQENKAQMQQLFQLIQTHPGAVPVILVYVKSGEKRMLAPEYAVENSAGLQEELGQLLGFENVVFK
ncbi:DNA polymerase III subunit alpha [Enterococcus asini]|uniref:DNA polymerase III subunit alpha n=1 Tax=Enterococcus asini TaxID=57732 RepID=UPI00288F646C|nr:DNA polymerase III subunit alpha [Enterococcus asini]MDT2745137.1 DNA polymerase III subunit alpha [Enterococcus asini]MDT2764860.1 DNA polymerase III subunit alpha [Enterococcus asini]